MKLALLTLVCCAFLPAQDLSFYVHPTNGGADTPLSASYQFLTTPEGSSADVILKAVNSTAYTIFLGNIYIGNQSGSSVINPYFSISGLNASATIGPGASTSFMAHFNPTVMGNLIGYLQASYLVQKNGCLLGSSDPATQCPTTIAAVSTLSGTATSAQLVLSCSQNGSNIVLAPNSSIALDFGSVSTSGKQTLTFTLTNQSSAVVATPAIAIQNGLYSSSAFSINTSGLPSSLDPNAAGTFTVSFAPSQVGLATTTLLIGSLPYAIQGNGVVVSDSDLLQIYYVDQNGVRTLPQAATPISLGQVIAGTGGTSTLTFTVANPSLSIAAVALQAISVSGAGFTLSALPNLPASIQPGAAVTFSLTFSGGTAGSYSGTLTIGTRPFSLTAISTVSPVPPPSFSLSQPTLLSQQQVDLTIQLASASTVPAVGTLTLQFVPSVTGVSDDPAIVFVASGGRQLQVNVAAGGTTATYKGQSAVTFQTGTTAGTITFTVTFPNGAPYSQSFQISPASIHVTSATAVRKTPNLVVTITGYDNTYSAGQLSFTFYDTSGRVASPSSIDVNAASAFHQYFFTANQAGGAFSLQASFPVSGDTAQVGAVTIKLTNSAGTTSSSQNFQ